MIIKKLKPENIPENLVLNSNNIIINTTLSFMIAAVSIKLLLFIYCSQPGPGNYSKQSMHISCPADNSARRHNSDERY